MKNIIIFSHEFPPYGGGVGVVAKQYCETLNSMGVSVTLVTRKQKEYLLPQEIDIVKIPHMKKFWIIPYIFYMFKIKLNSKDLILLNDMASVYVAGLLFNKKSLSKCIVFLHGSEPEKIYKAPSLFFKLSFFKHFYNKALVAGRKIISVSKYMKEKFLNETKFLNEDKIKVIYAGLDSTFTEKSTSVDINKSKREEILTVSRIEKDKGFDEMYSIFKHLIDIEDAYTWRIIGDGNYLKEFQQKIINDKIGNRIIFEGKVPRNKLKDYYKRADVFLLLSKYKESFGLVYIEAQAFGCPAIGYNKYGVKEAIENNVTGYLVNNGEECLDILLNKDYKSLRNFDSFVKRFSPKELQKNIKKELFC